ncbi:unnamed protein product [Mytilus coruscus]|uniref:Uncharacterized protein n=1 Tax=Mytilus coruscus TaxID=42192 RepID=A0A6J8F1H4_MYTCO|nr:unnamed protein product [Mytilus coruscus]
MYNIPLQSYNVSILILDTKREPCSTAKGLSVVNICKDDTKIQDMSNSVLIKANTTENCTCKLYVTNQDQDIAVNIQKYGQQKSSSPSHFGCGLVLEFEIRGNTFWESQCIVENRIITISITNNDEMAIRSIAVNGTLKPDEGYCIEIRKASHVGEGNKLNLTCGIDRTPTSDTTQSAETTTKMGKTTNLLQPPTTTATITTTTATVPTKLVPTSSSATTTTTTTTTATTTTIETDEFTTATITSADDSGSTKQTNQQSVTKDNDDTTILAAGAAGGGFVILIVVIIVVVVFYRRYHQKPTSKPGPAFDNEYDAYGMRDNVLYVSSQPTDIAEPKNQADCQDTKRISVDIDGNYSTVDLDEIPTVEESTGDYSSIALDKLTPSKSNMNESTNEKPMIAPKPKQKMTIQDDVYSVPDKKRVKHVTAPGKHGCEYAVVSKPNKSNFDKSEDQLLTSNVYAVVAKKKRMSDEKGTNQKRDSLASENNRETGQSSKN